MKREHLLFVFFLIDVLAFGLAIFLNYIHTAIIFLVLFFILLVLSVI